MCTSDQQRKRKWPRIIDRWWTQIRLSSPDRRLERDTLGGCPAQLLNQVDQAVQQPGMVKVDSHEGTNGLIQHIIMLNAPLLQ